MFYQKQWNRFLTLSERKQIQIHSKDDLKQSNSYLHKAYDSFTSSL